MQWCIREIDTRFIYRMEEIFDLYQQPFSVNYPLVCFDEKPVQLISEKYEPISAKPGQVARYDYQYIQEGTRNRFGYFEPKAGWRQIAVTERRTKDVFCE